jgi:hypothetical protein
MKKKILVTILSCMSIIGFSQKIFTAKTDRYLACKNISDASEVNTAIKTKAPSVALELAVKYTIAGRCLMVGVGEIFLINEELSIGEFICATKPMYDQQVWIFKVDKNE